MNESMRRYAAELLGTFALVFIGTSVATLQGFVGQGPAGWLGISFAFGFTLMVLVWVIGPVSGCHINPAVTLVMAVSKRMPRGEAGGYVAAQLLGGLAASGVLLGLMSGFETYDLARHGLGANGNPKSMAVGALVGWEVVLTALFLYTILSATRAGTPAAVTGLAIGGFLFVAHLIGVPLGDSSLNPARSLGPALLEGGAALKVVWVFVVGPLVGGLVGLGLYKVVYGACCDGEGGGS